MDPSQGETGWTPPSLDELRPGWRENASSFELYLFSQERLPKRAKRTALPALLEAIDRAIALTPRQRALYYYGKARILASGRGNAREDARQPGHSLPRSWNTAASRSAAATTLTWCASDWIGKERGPAFSA